MIALSSCLQIAMREFHNNIVSGAYMKCSKRLYDNVASGACEHSCALHENSVVVQGSNVAHIFPKMFCRKKLDLLAL